MASLYDVAKTEETPEESRRGTYAHLEDNFDTVAEHMNRRYGMTENTHSRDEIIESFENAMRGFNSGNSVRVASELSYLSRAEDNDIQASQAAYDVWDSAGSVFTSDAGIGEKLDAVGDYARSFVLDPVNAVSLGFGRVASRLGGAGARKVALEAANAAATRAAARAAANGVEKEVVDRVRRTAFAAAQRNILRGQTDALDDVARETVRRGSRRAVRADIGATTVAEMTAGGSVDALYQQAQIKAGRSNEYSWGQGAFSTLAGGLGGIFAIALASRKGTNGLALVSTNMNRQSDIAQSAAELSFENAEMTTRQAAQKLKDGSTELRNGIREMIVDVDSFAERVSQGELLKLRPYLNDPEMRSNFVAGMIMNGDPELGIRGINQIFRDLGIPEYAKRGPKDTRTNFIGDVLETLPKAVKNDIETFANNILKEVNPNFKGFSIKELSNFNAENVSNASRVLLAAKGLKKVSLQTGKGVDDLTATDIMRAEIDPLGETFAKGLAKEEAEETAAGKVEGWVGKAQRRWISMLITHPATTALNAVGWAGATSVQSLTDVFKGALYGGRAALRIGTEGGGRDLRRMGRLWSLQAQKIKNLADPYTTLDNFMDYVTVRPELQKEMFSYISGGVEASKSLVRMGVDPDEAVSLSKPQQVQRVFQTMYGVRAQDFLSKAQEYMYAIDKQIRQEFDMTFNDFMAQDDINDFLLDKASESAQKFLRIETRATNQALENIFAKSYKHEPGVIGKVAGIIEDARNVPVIGTMIPFGQFFNNTVATMLKATPLNPMYHVYLTATKKAGRKVEGDIMESMAKMSAGVSLAAMLAVREMSNLEDGLSWSEERKTGGTVVDRALDFPYSYYKMLGRMGAHLRRDGEIPRELGEEFLRTFGPESITRSIGDTGKTLNEVFLAIVEGDTRSGEVFGRALVEAGANYFSGATRVLDPFNQILASQRGEDYVAIDRRQGNQFYNNALRYVDQFVEVAKGEPLAPERNQSLSGEEVRPNLSKLFGIREVLPATNIQKMFNEIGRPDWIDGINIEDQQAENIFRGVFFPFVEMEASRLYDSQAWSTLSINEKTEIVNRVMSNTRTRTREYLTSQRDPADRQVGLIAQIDARLDSVGREDKREIFNIFQVDPRELHTLNLPQLELLLSFIEGDGERDALVRDRVDLD